MRHIIAVDPGHETGIILFEGRDIVLSVTDMHPYSFLQSLIDTFPSADVICERSPESGHQPEATHYVERLVERETAEERLNWVRPSEWKGHPAAVLTQEETQATTSTHERDAAKLGKWFINTQRRHIDAPV